MKMTKLKSTRHNKRFAAKLLFQFRVEIDGSSGIRRLCESRVIQFEAMHAEAAFREANVRARKKQHSYKNSNGNMVYYEFIGVQELLCLDPGCDEDEVWYDLLERVKPLENKNKWILPKNRL